MQFSQEAVDLIKAYEGFKSTPYVCLGGHLTIGYGHKLLSGDPHKTINMEEATKLLTHDLIIFCSYINQRVKVTLKQGQYDAICSLVYNWGCTNFGKSKGLLLLNQGKFGLAATEFFSKEKGVVNVNGKFSGGLYRRRQAELKLWERA
jgi:lysozyme